jgi:hypothetical protein
MSKILGKTKMAEDTRLEDLYHTLLRITAELVNNGYDAMEISAVMTRVAFQIYKTKLTNEDFNRMVDFISQSRDEIQPFSLDIPLQ